jgi:hypothetical protein
MTTITAFRYTDPTTPGWKNTIGYESGPTINMESDSLENLPDVLTNIWAKGWTWVEIETPKNVIKFYKSYGNYHAIAVFGAITEKK